MVSDKLKNIFLSASIPLKERDPKYFETADVIAIRDAVIALAISILPRFKLIWGGHPSITPIIYNVLEKLNMDIQDHVTLYQSEFFIENFHASNFDFNNVILTRTSGTKESSVRLMRERMFSENNFTAAIFIGGMDGILEEYEMFRKYNSKALILPIASTGAASKLVYDRLRQVKKNERLLHDYEYMSLFQDLLIDQI